MALLQDSTGYYLEPSTGQYYQTYTRPTYHNPYGYNNAFGWNQGSLGGMAGMMGIGGRAADPEGMISEGGQYYIPFTGNAVGISQGKRSVVDALMNAKKNYQYNVPSIAQLFPSMVMPTFNAQPVQYTGGAGQYLGGLLGTGGASQYLSAPQTTSSGAGRFA